MNYYNLIVDYTLGENSNRISYPIITFNAEYVMHRQSISFSALAKNVTNTKVLENLVYDNEIIINKVTIITPEEEVVYEDTIWNKLSRIYVMGDSLGYFSKNLQFIIGE